MNNNYVIAFISNDKDIILEPLAEFNGDTMYFKNEYDAKEYINKLYVSIFDFFTRSINEFFVKI